MMIERSEKQIPRCLITFLAEGKNLGICGSINTKFYLKQTVLRLSFLNDTPNCISHLLQLSLP